MILCSSALFALMGLCVKLASANYGSGEIVLYRSLIGLVLMAAMLRLRSISPGTRYPLMHFWRSASGTLGLCLWFAALGALPLATAMTLNYMSSVWVALFLVGIGLASGAGRRALDGRRVAAVLLGFVGVAMVLRPTLDQNQIGHGLMGLMSGMLSAIAYLQVSAMGRLGEPGERIVFYFSITGTVAGLALTLATGGFHAHTPRGALLLAAIGLLATAAQWLMTRAYGTGAAMGVAALQYMGIVYSFILGVWLFGDEVTPLALGGMGLIIGAGVLATLLGNRVNAPASTRSAPVLRVDAPVPPAASTVPTREV